MSSDGKINIDMQTNIGSVLRNQEELNKSMGKLTEKVGELDRGAKTVGRTYSQMQAAAARHFAEEAKGVETLKQKRLELNVLLKQGHIDQETYNRRLASINQELLKHDVQYQKSQQQTIKILDAKRATEADLHAAARKWAAATETDAERQKRNLLELNVLRRKNLITEEQHTAAVKSLGTAGSSTFSSMVQGAGKTALAVTGIGTAAALALKALQLVNAEIDAGAQRAKNAANQTIDEAPRLRGMYAALGTDSRMTPEQANAEVDRVAKETKAKRSTVIDTFTSGFSARGDLSPADAVIASQTALALDPSMPPEQAQDIGGAILDIQKRTKMTPREATGNLLAGAQQARVTNFGLYAKNIAPAVANLISRGLTAEEAFELTSSATQEMTDKTGASSGTASEQLAAQIYEATTIAGLPKETSFTERKRFLESDPRGIEFRKQMLGVNDPTYDPKNPKRRGSSRPGSSVNELTLEVKAKTWGFGMLTPGSAVNQRYDATRSTFGSPAEGGKFYDQLLAQNQTNAPLRIAGTHEKFQAFIESQQAIPGRAAAGVVMGQLDELQKATGADSVLIGSAKNKINEFSLGGDVSETQVYGYAASQLEGMANSVIPPRADPSRQIKELFYGDRAYSGADRNLVEGLRLLAEEIRENNRLLERRAATESRSLPSPNGPRPAIDDGRPREP